MRKFSRCRLIVGLIVCGSMLLLPESFTSTRNQLNAQEVGFLEDFALAQDREKALKQLVPGTESYYYFHALHYQNTQQLDKVDQLMEAWSKRLGQSDPYKRIRNRQALLKYSDDPQATLDFLKKELSLNFAHQRRIPDAQRELPTKLDPDIYSTETLLERSLSSSRSIGGIKDSRLSLLADRELTKNQRRDLLSRLKRPDFPGVVDLIVADLKERDSRAFGSMAIQKSLTLAQLDELIEKYPELESQTKFVDVYLSKLLPSADVDWQQDPTERRKYLDRLWSFVEPLNPTFNSLKATVLFRILELDHQEGKMNRERFMTYLKLPRNVHYANPIVIKNVESRMHIVSMSANYSKRCYLPPINNDETLVRHYLHHFLVDAADSKDFEPWVKSDHLKKQFAFSKILSGIGDVEQWASMLTPAAYESIVKRVDVEFVPTNPEVFGVDDDVSLELYLKNVDNLIVKIFEINTSNYYRKYRKEIDTDINLDGLLPNFEQTYDYDEPPSVRKKRQFKFPQIKNRGVYVVDFIAGGKSCRALIRKGRLQMFSQVTPAGQLLTVFDQSGAMAMDAEVRMGLSRFTAMDSGKILIPFSTRPGRVPAIISQGDFCCLQKFDHVAEKYQFRAAMVLDRENLTRGRTAKILIRPSLRIVGGNPVPVSMLTDAKLVISSTSLDRTNATKVIPNLKFTDSEDTVCEFMVPPRLTSLSLKLQVKYKNRTLHSTDHSMAMQGYAINSIDQSQGVQDVHLLPTDKGYFLEVRGKTGEPRPNQPVILVLQPADFSRSIVTEVQSDESGRVDLGQLKNIRSFKANFSPGEKSFHLNNQDQTLYQTVHAPVGQPIEIPAPVGMTERTRNAISLLEIRNNTFVKDCFETVTVKDGRITVSDLPPGDYDLRLTYPQATQLTEHRDIKIRITEGPRTGNVLIGKHRHLETRGSKMLHVAKVSNDDANIEIQLENIDAHTRVHVIANRYQPAFDSYRLFAGINDIEPWMGQPPTRRTVYMEGRKIGDEYAYILRRKYAQKYPGNMLSRPSLLLNQWEAGATTNRSQQSAKGSEYGAVGNKDGSSTKRGSGVTLGQGSQADSSNLDFLGNNSVLLANLKPNDQGVVSIEKDKLGSNQHVRIIALNALHTIERTVNLPAKKLKPRDSRLAKPLDPAKHFTQSKQVKTFKKGDTLAIDDIASAKFQQYDDLGDVFQLYQSLNPQAGLQRFYFILEWLEKSKEEKLELYSEHASHELNYFVMRKDPEFFKSVIQPHLRHKRDKTFFDRWLLEEDVSEFASPYNFSKLNAFERILLSQRLEENSADIIRHINEAYLCVATKPARFNMLYDQAISGRSLEVFKGINREVLERMKNSKKQSYFQDKLQRQTGQIASQGLVSGGAPVFSAPAEQPTPGDISVEPNNVSRKSNVGKSTNEPILNEKSRLTLNRETAGKAIPKKGDKSKVPSKGKRFGTNRFMKTRQTPVTRTRLETRTRSVPVTKTRTETRTMTHPDGRQQSYTVSVPYTENTTQNYTISVPFTENVTESFFDVAEFEKLDKEVQQLYQRLAPTKVWLENNYYLLPPRQQTTDRVKVNRFWRDYSNHETGAFLSDGFIEAHHSFTEMMFALSVLDLPLKSPEHDFEFVDGSMKMTATAPVIAFHQQVRDAAFDLADTRILVSENFFQTNDRYRHKDGVRLDKFVTGKFLAHTLYGSQVVITNPTSAPQTVELLVQVPQGAIACAGSQQTQTVHMRLPAFGTLTHNYSFYFPAAGEFEHYPAHVSTEEKVLAVAEGQSFDVIDRAAEVDEKSWEFVSQNGTPEQVLKFVEKENILRLKLDQIAFRMKDADFFKQVIDTLRNRYVYDTTLWSYSVMHNDADSLREFLAHNQKIATRCGKTFQSELLTIDPVERNWYQHKEFWPLINDRAHQLGASRKILNPSFFTQYKSLLNVLSNRRELSDDDHLVVTYYMLLQDRIETALAHFDQVSREAIPCDMQYDYCDAYLDMYRAQPEAAKTKAARWTDYPVNHWRERFQRIVAQVDELEGAQPLVTDQKDTIERQTELAAQAGSFEVEIGGAGKAKLSYQNVGEFEVNYYEMDIELLFSRSPFAKDNLNGFSLIRPNVTQNVSVKKKGDAPLRGVEEFELAPEMENRNVLIEVVAGDQIKSLPHFANSLNVQTIQRYGQIYVTEKETAEPIPRSYVKVYAKTTDGTVRFHKDGYTDLRGRFDYISQSNRPVDEIETFSILVLSEKNGAVIRQAELPQE